METKLEQWLNQALEPIATPDNYSSYELVLGAIEHNSPPRIPYSFIEPVQSDFFELEALDWQRRLLHQQTQRQQAQKQDSIKNLSYTDEWGIDYTPAEGLFDYGRSNPLADLSTLSAYQAPRFDSKIQTLLPLAKRAKHCGKYVVAGDPVCLYEKARALMGFEALMTAPLTQTKLFPQLLSMLTDATIDVIDQYGKSGDIHGFMTWQDFGLQTGLPMRMDCFREHYKPCFERMISACHSHGMHFVWHCCGDIMPLIPDMISLNVDILQLDQPRLLGHQNLADNFGGKICFWNCIDTQWCTNKSRSDDEINSEVKAMRQPFAKYQGGFIARHYPQPWDIGLDSRFHNITKRAFLDLF